MITPARSVAEVLELLSHFGTIEVETAGDVPAVLVSHGVQCAELLAAEYPDDFELQVAGLLHDVGLLLVPGDEIGHPRHGANYVRPLFGSRVADIILLHVDAQRYFATTIAGYNAAPAPTVGFAEQPLAYMIAEEVESFESEPLFKDVIAFRQADDAGKDEFRRGDDLRVWVDRMNEIVSLQVSRAIF